MLDMKKTAIALSLALLYTTLAGTLLVNSANGNPYSQAIYQGTIDAPYSPEIRILTQNGSILKQEYLSIPINVSIIQSKDTNYQQFLYRIFCRTNWTSNETEIYKYGPYNPSHIQPRYTNFEYILNLTNIPSGKHEITFFVEERGYYYPSLFEYYMLSSNISSTINFTFDIELPTVSVISIENK
jgi:hypothetical protein